MKLFPCLGLTRRRLVAGSLLVQALFAPLVAGAQGLEGLTLGAAELSPAFDPAVVAYAATVPAMRTGIAVHPRVASVARTLHLRDAEGRFRPLAPGATLAAGRSHLVALRNDGSVVAWGGNTYGQAMVPAAAASGVVAVTAGRNISLALKSDGSVVLWGENAAGVLAVPVEAQSGVVAVAGGAMHALVLKEDGSVVAWGNNSYGQASVPAGALSDVVAIAAGAFHSVALKADGTVLTWGSNQTTMPSPPGVRTVAIAASEGYTMALRANGDLTAWGSAPSGGSPATNLGIPANVAPVVGIAAGYSCPATLRADGSVQVWGTGPSLLLLPPAVRDAAALAVGEFFAAALKPDGSLRVWGATGEAALNVPSAAATGLRLPAGARVAVPSGETALELRVAGAGDLALERVTLAAGGNQTLVLDANGDPAAYSSSPGLPAAATDLVAIANGAALKADGSVIGWSDVGGNFDPPAEVTAEPAVAVGAMGSMRFALGRSGALRGWGSAANGLLAIPSGAQSNVAAFDLGAEHALAARDDGLVVAWGSSAYNKTTVPTEAQSGVVAVAAGYYHSVALRADRALVFWGKGYTDTGSSAYVYTPPKAVAKIDAGRDFTAVLFVDGTFELMGDSSLAVLTTWPSSARESIVDFVAGMDHVTIRKADGTLVTWGARTATQVTTGDLLRAGPPGDATIVVATRDAPSAALAALRSSAGALTPEFASGTLSYAQTASSMTKVLALAPRSEEPLAGWELAANGGPTRRMGLGATLAAGSGFNFGINTQGALISWGSPPSSLSALPASAQSGVVAIAVGSGHALALKSDGSLATWGPFSSPLVDIPPAARYDVASIAARANSSAVVKRDGTLVVWGTDSAVNTVPSAATSGVAAISLGFGHAVALKSDGSVIAWGSSGAPTPTSVASGVVAVAAGQSYSLALKADGAVVAWGSSGLGINTVPASVGQRAVAIAAGRYHALVLLDDGSVVTWGTLPAPTPTTAGSGVAAIFGGDYHSSVIKTDGSVVTWGITTYASDTNIRLQMPPGAAVGVRSGTNRIELRTVAAEGAPLAATPLVAGRDRNWFLRADGTMFAAPINLTTSFPTPPAASLLRDNVTVGIGAYGEYAVRFDGTVQVVRGASPPSDLTTTVIPSSGVRPRAVRVAVAENFAAALLEDGSVRSWGAYTSAPSELASGTLALSAGRYHVIGLTARGGASVWGNASSAAASVPSWARSGLLAVAAGDNFNIVLKGDGTLAAWGDNVTAVSSVPMGSDFIAIASGDHHAAALRRDGSVVAWGDPNNSGQTVVPVLAQSGVVAIAAASGHTLALRADGRVIAWGNSAFSPGYAGFSPGTRRTYVIEVTRPPAVPALTELGTSSGGVTPAFSADVLRYSQSIASETAAAGFSARALEPGQLQLRVNGGPFQRAASGASIAAGYNFVVGIGPGGGAVFPTSVSSSYSSVPAAAQSDLVAVAAGSYHVLALRADGTTAAWGSASAQTLAIPSSAAGGVAAIAARYYNSLALRRDGSVVGWGLDATLANPPSTLGNDNRAVALGTAHALVLKNDGSVVQWGSTSVAPPPTVSSGVVEIAAGANFSLARKADGTVVAWGGASAIVNLPEIARSGVVRISAGVSQAYFLKTDGSHVIWDGGVSSLVPPASFANAVADFAGGDNIAAALLVDGRVSAWGGNSTLSGAVSPVSLSLGSALPLREGVNRLDVRVTPTASRILHEASFATGVSEHFVVTAAGSVQRSQVSESIGISGSALPSAAQSGVHAVYTRGSGRYILRHDGSVVALSGITPPAMLQPGYVPSGAVSARVIALAPAANDVLTLRADGSVFAWIGDNLIPAEVRNDIVSIASSNGGFFAVRRDGRLFVWSVNGMPAPELPPETQSGVLAVAGNLNAGVVLKNDGTLFAWPASNPLGQIPVGATDIVAIAAADNHFLALRRDGVVFSWGLESALRTVPVEAQTGVVALAAGPSHALALRQDGTFVAWGRHLSGAPATLAPSAEGLLSEPIRTYTIDVTRAYGAPGPDALRAVGGQLAPAFSRDTSVYSLPDTRYPAFAFFPSPSRVLAGSAEVRVGEGSYAARLPGSTIAASDYVILALSPAGAVSTIGSGSLATLPTAALSSVVSVAAGRDHALVLRRDGKIHAWGSNSFGQTNAPATADFVAIAAGREHCLALTQSGRVVAWGRGLEKQTTVPAAAQSGVTAIAAGELTSIALKTDGTVVAWGRNATNPQTIPADAQGNIVAVAAGRDHYLALRADGRVVQWGSGFSGGVPPFRVIGIAAGGDGNFALRADGAVVTWSSGQSVVLPVSASRGVAAMTLGHYHGALLRQDGSLLVVSSLGTSLTAGNDTPAYAGPFALPVSARVPIGLGTNAVWMRFARADGAVAPAEYRVDVARLPAPALRMVAGTDLISGDPYQHSFGSFVVGGSGAQLFTLHNPGTATLEITSHVVTGSAAGDFAVSGLPASLAVPAGGSVAFTVTAAPTTTGNRFAVFLPAVNLPDDEAFGFGFRATGFTHASELGAWRLAYFTAQELADPALETTLWGDQADPDGDGLPNLMEYALRLAPRVAGASPVQIAFDAGAAGGPRLTLVYTRSKRAAAAGLVYRVQASDTLASDSWSAIDVVETVSASDAETETVSASVAADVERRFLRLQVTAP